MQTNTKPHRSLDLVAIILLFVLLGLALGSYAGNPTNKEESGTSVQLLSFQVKQVEGTNYLNWLIRSNTADYVFYVERIKADGTSEYISIKQGAVSPDNQQLLFCCQDKNNADLAVSYRLHAYKISSAKNDETIVLETSDLFSDVAISTCVYTPQINTSDDASFSLLTN